MEALIDLSWRVYPAGLIAALGAALTLRGAGRLRASFRRPSTDTGNDLLYMHGFRITIWGLTLVGLAAAWTWHLIWLFALALVICGEETLETSLAIYALRQPQQLEVRARRAARGPEPG